MSSIRNMVGYLNDDLDLCTLRFPRAFTSLADSAILSGPIIRVSPNELSFASVGSWKGIYGSQSTGKPALVKSEFYEMYGAGFNSTCIGSERDPSKHARMRRLLSPAFSAKVLKDQEDIVGQTIDAFVVRIGRDGAPGSKGLNMTKWYEMVAFDILGEMAFGESFHCIENGKLKKNSCALIIYISANCNPGKPHFWSELILDHLFFVTVADNLRRFPLVTMLFKTLFPSTVATRNKNSTYSRAQVSR